MTLDIKIGVKQVFLNKIEVHLHKLHDLLVCKVKKGENMSKAL